MSATTSVGGLISGLDTNSILDQLRELAEAPIRRVESRRSLLNSQQVAWSLFEGKLLALRTAANRLATASTFQSCAATVSHPELLTAAASATAAPGAYSFRILQLAQSHQLVSGGFADISETELGSGTLSLQVGEADPTLIDISGLTLAELRDAINASVQGVSAAIVSDGAGATPYRLVITSRTSGLAGQIGVISQGEAPTVSDLQPAQDAQLQLGAGAVTITSSTNHITQAIPGVTLDLIGADPAQTITVTVARDPAPARAAISKLVGAYNDLAAFFDEQFHYDATTGQSGTLFSDYQLQSLQQALAAELTSQVIGASPELSALSQLGLRVDGTGRLIETSATIDQVLRQSLDGVALLLTAAGRTTHPAVTYLSAGTETQPSGAAGWTVSIVRPASRASVTAGVAQTGALGQNEVVTIQGVAIGLAAGMTPEEVVSAINAYQAQTGVVATRVEGRLTLRRLAYGSAYHLEAWSNVSNQGAEPHRTSGLGTVLVTDTNPAGENGLGTGAAGQDVTGTIGGWPATGRGRQLTGAEGDAEGLALLVAADAPGAYGEVVFTVGVAEKLLRIAVAAGDPSSGTIARSRGGLEDAVTDLEAEIARLRQAVDQEQERLRASFVRMEQALSQFQIQSSFLASQLAQIQRNRAAAG